MLVGKQHNNKLWVAADDTDYTDADDTDDTDADDTDGTDADDTDIYLTLINISHHINSFFPLFPTKESQGQGWSKLPWYSCNNYSSWLRNLSNSALLLHVDTFGFH